MDTDLLLELDYLFVDISALEDVYKCFFLLYLLDWYMKEKSILRDNLSGLLVWYCRKNHSIERQCKLLRGSALF